MILRGITLGGVVFVCACQKMPETYAPPEQRQPFENFRPYRASRIVNMAAGEADGQIVRDISNYANGTWRWTGQHPTVRVPRGTSQALRFVIDFTIPEVTFKQTGPVSVSFYVNDHLLDTARYAAPGNQHFEKAVPPDWIEQGTATNLSAEIDKVYVSANDSERLGFILSSIGLKQE